MPSPIAFNLLAPLELLYAVSVRARGEFYRRDIFKSHRVDAPVISVGNITTGGTGKTPLVAWLARLIAERGDAKAARAWFESALHDVDASIAAAARAGLELGDAIQWIHRLGHDTPDGRR